MLALGDSLRAEPAESAPADFAAAADKKPGTEKPKDDKKDKKTPELPKGIFDFPPLMGGQFPTGFNPQMMGDFPGVFARRTVTLIGMQTVTTTTTPADPGLGTSQPTRTTQTTTPVVRNISILVPALSAAAFKVAENESPRPVDRVFFTYNYFSNLRDPQQGIVSPVGAAQSSTMPTGFLTTTTTTVDTNLPGLARATANLHREVFGFEKTFLDGFASIEMRLPVVQQTSNIGGFGSQGVGDLTILGKYALLLDRETGNVFSAGFAVTAPTGRAIETDTGPLHPTLLQPWFGYIANADRFFVQGFHSVVVPTDSRFPTLLFNDVGVNFWLYRGDASRLVNFIVPMIEGHVTTPLNHRDGAGSLVVPDLVIMTGGAHIGLFGRSTLSIGVATPVTGPRLFNVEAFAQWNLRF